MITDLTNDLFYVVLELLSWYRWVVIIAVIWSYLVNYNVLDRHNRAVWTIGNILERLTEPLFRRIRRVVPPFGGFDWSPFVLLLLILVAMQLVIRIQAAVVFGDLNGLLF